MSSKKKRIGTCAICGSVNVEVTDDHVPPKNIFLKPRPQNMIEVPGCGQCNNGSSMLDQKFGVYLSLHAALHHKSAEKMLKTNTIATLKENQRLLRHIKDGIKPAYLTTETGVIYDKADVLLWDSESYDSIIERTIRGFYWNHFNEVLGDKATVTVCMFKEIPKEISDGFSICQHGEVGTQGELVYKYVRDPDNPLKSIWLLVFYHSLIAFGITKPKQEETL